MTKIDRESPSTGGSGSGTEIASELKQHPLAGALARIYAMGWARRRVLGFAGRLEGGQMRSATQRSILLRFHDVQVGAYSYGSCFEPGAFPGGARVGRYVSIAAGVTRRLNHPVDRMVMHPFFYNEKLGVVTARMIAHAPIEIGHDAWIGQGVIFTENCRKVGIGAVIGAGSIVTREVGDFEIVAGNPARCMRRRFPDALCDRIVASRWWEKPLAELAVHAQDLGMPVMQWKTDHPLLESACDPRATMT